MKHKGFTLVEMLLAMALFGFAMTGIMSFSSWMLGSIQTEAAKSSRNTENRELIKLVTQPVFFGAQSKYLENTNLKNCMNADSVLCNINTTYPLTVFDPTTNLLIKNISSDKSQPLLNSMSFKVHCGAGLTECDKAEYFTVIVKTALSANGFSVAEIEKRGTVIPEFTNVITYIPDATLSPGRPINVLLFIDTSNSMLFAKDQIKDSLAKLTEKLSTMDANVSLLDLSGDIFANTFLYTLDGLGNKVPAFPIFPGNFTYYQDTTFQSRSEVTFNPAATGDPFVNDFSYPRNFQLITTDTPVVRTKKLAAINTAIDKMFTLAGPSIDLGFCSLIRYLEQPYPSNPLKLDSFTPTVVMVISNEDDETVFGPIGQKKCNRGQTTKFLTSPDFYSFYYETASFYPTLSFKVISDGAPKDNFILKTIIEYPFLPPANFVEYGDCMEQILKVSPALITKTIEAEIAGKYKTLNVVYNPADGYKIDACMNLSTTRSTYIKTTAPSTIDYCPEIEARTNANYHPNSYISGTCLEKKTLGGQYSSSILEHTDYNYYPETTSAVTGVYEFIKKNIGLASLYYVPIIHPDNTTCTLTLGAQVGVKYKQLAEMPNVKSAVVPICSPTFDAGIDKIAGWTQTLAASDLTLPASVASNLGGIEIVRASTVITLTENKDYKLSGTTLIFTSGLVQPNDIIKVYLK